jgi:Spy/CpxP family protein refolding chaperone
MRRMGLVLGAVVLALAAVTMAAAQQGGFGGFGGGFGGGGAGQDLAALLRIEQIKKELEITDEQVDKVPAAVSKALKEVLDDKQHKRLTQISLQLRGVRAFTDAEVQTQLKLTAEQKDNINTILEDSQRETRELFKEAKGGNFQGIQEKSQAIQKETRDKVNGVLTADQRKAFRAMTGEEFKLETKGFGGFKGFGKKKKDTQ